MRSQRAAGMMQELTNPYFLLAFVVTPAFVMGQSRMSQFGFTSAAWTRTIDTPRASRLPDRQ